MYELKEKAKWSSNSEEKKTAIKELSTHGLEAVPFLEEILNITAYEEVKMACIEAIRAVSAEQSGERGGGHASTIAGATTSASVPKTDTKIQKKEEREQEDTGESERRLADLPP